MGSRERETKRDGQTQRAIDIGTERESYRERERDRQKDRKTEREGDNTKSGYER